MRKSFALACVALVAIAAPGAAANVEIGGYIDVGWYDQEGGGTNGRTAAGHNMHSSGNPALQGVGSTNGAQTTAGQQTSAVNEVNIDLTAELADNVTVFASFDAIPTGGRSEGSNSGGSTVAGITGSAAPALVGGGLRNGGALTLDMAYIDFQNPGAMPINVRVGAIPSVIGIEQREAESNQKRTISLSLLSPFTVGAIVGTGVYGSFDFINYQLALANTDPFGAGASYGNTTVAPTNQTININLQQLAPENNGRIGADNNNNRTIQGRLGITPLEGLELGVSGSMGKFASPVTNLTAIAGTNDQERRIVGFDAGYVWGPWSAKAEYIAVDEDNSANGGADDNQLRAWYVEGAYEFGSLASMAKSGGLVLRYTNMDQDVDGDNVTTNGSASVEAYDVDQIVIGGWLDLSADVRMKLEYQINDEDSTPNYGTRESENDVFSLSTVASF